MCLSEALPPQPRRPVFFRDAGLRGRHTRSPKSKPTLKPCFVYLPFSAFPIWSLWLVSQHPAVDCIYTRVSVLAGGVFFLCFTARCRFTPCIFTATTKKKKKKSIRLLYYTFHPSSPCFLRLSRRVTTGGSRGYMALRERGSVALTAPRGVAWHSRSPVSALLPLPHFFGVYSTPLASLIPHLPSVTIRWG